uniref:Breast cancer anti-estrogen resistance protein 1 n=1 Tax=Lygus hesperus TaxID=30085 RepID=A0A146LTI9_LYGHE
MPQQDPAVLNYPICMALYDNTAETPDELSFTAGEILVVLEQESPGLDGWWVCSLEGRQGICPSNRLKMLTEAEQALKKQAWQNHIKTPVSAGVKPEVAFLYDSPVQRHCGTPQPSSDQYDVPPTAQSVQVEESYDTPKPVGGVSMASRGAASLTPSSSISSLTTDSNRSSLIQQDYDVPRPIRVQPPQGVYDVPKGGEVSLDMTAALEWLGRLEADVTGSISRLLGLATAGWRTRAKMEPRMMELRGSVCRLTSSLHDLTVFSHAVLATHHETGLGAKLGPLVAALNKADLQVKDCVHKLEAIGWSVNQLSVEEHSTAKDSDTLDKLVQTAAAVTDDIRAIASFIQGNSTLLFKRNVPQTPEEGQYMNLSGRGMTNEEYVEPTSNATVSRPTEANGTNGHGRHDGYPREDEVPEIRVLSSGDRKIVENLGPRYYLSHISLRQAIDGFLAMVTNNQPPKTFLSQCKLVVIAANQLLQIVEAIERSLENAQMKTEIASYNRVISEAVGSLSSKTITAATHFPSVRAVQRMVDAVEGLVPLPQQIWRILAAAG